MKKLITFIALLLLLTASVYLVSCKEGEELPVEEPYVTTPYEINLPEHLLHPDNPMTVEGVELGRMIFYDKMLHISGDQACADCHRQEEAFSFKDVNSLAHINMAYMNAFLWKGEVEGSMEDVMLFEVKDFFEADPTRFNNDPIYKDLFKKAFDTDEITYKHLAYALAQFERTLISADSKYDQYVRGKAQLTESEYRGMELFYSEDGDCFHCHGTALFTDNLFHNTGLDAIPEEGRYAITQNPKDMGAFKTPTLRNIALTPPYMHDGRFATLEEVIDFYSEGLEYSIYVDPLMKQVHSGGVNFNEQEKADLLAFLHTLTDSTFISNPAFSNPF